MFSFGRGRKSLGSGLNNNKMLKHVDAWSTLRVLMLLQQEQRNKQDEMSVFFPASYECWDQRTTRFHQNCRPHDSCLNFWTCSSRLLSIGKTAGNIL